MCCWLQGSIAKHPFPGYFGNSAGTTAYFLAYGSSALPALSALSGAHSPLPALLCLYSTNGGCGLRAPAPLRSPLACVGRLTGLGYMHGPCVKWSCMRAGICTMTCHRAHNVFDVVPGDVVGSVILATSAATVQVCRLTPDMQVLSGRGVHSACQRSERLPSLLSIIEGQAACAACPSAHALQEHQRAWHSSDVAPEPT